MGFRGAKSESNDWLPGAFFSQSSKIKKIKAIHVYIYIPRMSWKSSIFLIIYIRISYHPFHQTQTKIATNSRKDSLIEISPHQGSEISMGHDDGDVAILDVFQRSQSRFFQVKKCSFCWPQKTGQAIWCIFLFFGASATTKNSKCLPKIPEWIFRCHTFFGVPHSSLHDVKSWFTKQNPAA